MKKIAAFLLFVLVGCISLHAQVKQISGTVTSSEDGEPLPGVAVSVVGTSIGTATDIDGNFTLNVPEDAGTLSFSSVGFENKTVELAGQSQLTVTLEPDLVGLEEVVVTALGISRSEKSLGYSATSVNAEVFEENAHVDPMKALQGKVAGVNITSGGGNPNASTKVIIRGYSSLLGENNPLYVVDGTPIDNSTRANYTTGIDIGNRAADINPNDIESMTILKGAAATNLYGPRGANGVIIVTTKSGKQNQGLKVEFNSSATVTDVLRLPQMQNTFGQGWSGHWADDENGSWGPKMNGEVRPWGNVVDNAQKIKPFAPVEDNLYEFYDYGQQFYNSFALTGGNESSSFRLSYGNNSINGALPSDVDKSVTNNLSFKAATQGARLKASTSINYVRKDGSIVPDGYGGTNAAANLYSELLQIPRDFSVVDFQDYKTDEFDNIDNFYTPYAFNPYYAINENQTSYFENRIYGNVALDYKVVEWLTATWRVGGDIASFKRNQHEAIMNFSPGSYQDIKGVTENAGFFLEESRESRNLESDFILNFSKNISSDISFNGILGYNARLEEYERITGQISSLVIPEYYDIENTADDKQVETFRTEERTVGTYANATFGYRELVYLDLGARNEWSSTLPEKDRDFFYPQVSLSWIASETFAGLDEYFDLLKLRASWGKSGNDADPYRINQIFGVSQIWVPFSSLADNDVHSFPLAGIGAYELGDRLGAPDLTAEITTEYEFGINAEAFNGRIGIDLTFYDRVSDGQILVVDIAGSTGGKTRTQNFGEVQNRGIELLASVIPVKTQNFSWNLIANFTKNNNKVDNLPGDLGELRVVGAYDVDFYAINGMPLGQYKIPDFVRDDQGRIVVNSSNGIPEATTEKIVVGDIQEDFILGVTNSFRYKNFNFSFLFDYRPGGLIYSGTADLHYFVGNATQTTYNDRQPFIVPNSVIENPDYDPSDPNSIQYIENNVPIDKTNINAYWYHSQNQTIHRERLIPRGYLKLRDVSLSYRMPNKWFSEIPVSGAKITLSGRNLLLWTPEENNFIDPEVTSFGNNFMGDFGEFRTGPTYRSFTASLNLTF